MGAPSGSSALRTRLLTGSLHEPLLGSKVTTGRAHVQSVSPTLPVAVAGKGDVTDDPISVTRVKTRTPLSWMDIGPALGVATTIILLVGGGTMVLTGLDPEGNPVLGALALGAGLVLGFFVYRYLRRPVVPPPPEPKWGEVPRRERVLAVLLGPPIVFLWGLILGTLRTRFVEEEDWGNSFGIGAVAGGFFVVAYVGCLAWTVISDGQGEASHEEHFRKTYRDRPRQP